MLKLVTIAVKELFPNMHWYAQANMHKLICIANMYQSYENATIHLRELCDMALAMSSQIYIVTKDR